MLLQTTPKSFHERGWSRLHLAGSSSLIYLHRPTVRVPPLLRDYRFGPNSREKANPPSMMTPRGSHTLVLATRWFWWREPFCRCHGWTMQLSKQTVSSVEYLGLEEELHRSNKQWCPLPPIRNDCDYECCDATNQEKEEEHGFHRGGSV